MPSTSDSGPADARGPLAVLLPSASTLPVLLAALAEERDGDDTPVWVFALCSSEAALRDAVEAAGAALEGARLRAFDVSEGELGARHHLCDELRAALDEAGIGRTLAPAHGPGQSFDAIAAGILGAAALTGGTRSLRLVGDGVDECFAAGGGEAWIRARRRERATATGAAGSDESLAARPTVSAVISTWNKAGDVRANLLGLRAQADPFDEVVVVDNASSDDTAAMILRDFPEVRLVVMPHSAYGACETFNIGFSTAGCEQIAILDDDVVLPPEWLAKTARRMAGEPETTAVVSTKIVEPGMPESYRAAPELNRERYMSTFRGCASLARKDAIARAGFYDERLFIYGNERDLTCRLLNLGFRVLQYPGVETFHKTPFGIKMGKRSLYYHARNAFLGMLKYAPLGALVKLPFLAIFKVLLRGGGKEAEGGVTDATGTIGIGRSVRETPGAWWVLFKAAASVLYNVPYCWKRREPCRAPDFELPIE